MGAQIYLTWPSSPSGAANAWVQSVLAVVVSLLTGYLANLAYGFIHESPSLHDTGAIGAPHDDAARPTVTTPAGETRREGNAAIFVFVTLSIIAVLYFADFLDNVTMAGVDAIEKSGNLRFTSQGYLDFQRYLFGSILLFNELPALAIPCVALVWRRTRPSFAVLLGASAAAVVVHNIVPLLLNVSTGFGNSKQLLLGMGLAPNTPLAEPVVVIVQLGGLALTAFALALFVLVVMALTRMYRDWQGRRYAAR